MRWITRAILVASTVGFSPVSSADINVCIERGVKIIRSYPCKDGVKPKSTYPGVSIEQLPPSARRNEKTTKPAKQVVPYRGQPLLSNEQASDGISQQEIQLRRLRNQQQQIQADQRAQQMQMEMQQQAMLQAQQRQQMEMQRLQAQRDWDKMQADSERFMSESRGIQGR